MSWAWAAQVRQQPIPVARYSDDAVVWADCEINAQHDAGDRVIVVATGVATEGGQHGRLAPLVFFCGRYGAFTRYDGQTTYA